ncbi:MAG: 23S rRNA (guanosine(2251)-2'-O)-methyltransferase RlmB [Nitrospiraceae bacterium]
MARPAGSADRDEVLYGVHAVTEALQAGRPFMRLLVVHTHGQLEDLVELARSRRVPIHIEPKVMLDRLAQGGRHQGVVGVAAARRYSTVDDMLSTAAKRGEAPFLAILDGVQDPQNFGSVLRSAEGAGVHGVIIPDRRAVGLTGVVAKSSAGAIEHMRVAQVTNVVRTLEELKAAGLWLYGLDARATRSVSEVDYSGPVGFVLGGEGQGVRPGVLAACDESVRIPMRGKVSSLNAAAAAAIAFFEVVRQRQRR